MKGKETPPLVELSDLTVTYDGQVLIDSINLDVIAGETLAIVGESGAGKTTLLRSLLGVTSHGFKVSGSLTFKGQQQDLASHRSSDSLVKGSIAYVPQNPSVGLDPLKRLKWQWSQALRGARALKGTLLPKEQGAEEKTFSENILSQLKLKAFDKKYPHQWSRGMQQRLLLAFALIAKPKIIILDEPTSALDPIIAAKALVEVTKVARDHNISVLMVTHDLALATQFADRVAVLSSGKLIEVGMTDEILNSPSDPYTSNLVKHRHWGHAHA
ncbi:ATP-binding cassette domain-containing protein [uncultured Kiloniella sp.]|uniref:ATP-binding cassette domain-containing protein n=1 Tax=uncultured Kiloniella sp. TaxID=1133091 RepID=UPI0026189F44|nr:ATP-binding cassette domain-containing protein [uncultured Kiloniella sp.]